jgi:lactoylglutathione lyase
MKLEYVTMHVADLAASIAFYEEVLGFRLVRRFSPRPGMEIAFLGDGAGGQVEFISGGDGPTFVGKGISLGFTVPDIEATAALLRGKAVTILAGPLSMPNGLRMLRARDLNGMELGFIQEGPANQA